MDKKQAMRLLLDGKKVKTVCGVVVRMFSDGSICDAHREVDWNGFRGPFTEVSEPLTDEQIIAEFERMRDYYFSAGQGLSSASFGTCARILRERKL